MKILKIKSTVEGEINVLNPGNGFELLGMIEGEVTIQKDGCLNLYLLPIRTGQALLPSLLLGGKKGLW